MIVVNPMTKIIVVMYRLMKMVNQMTMMITDESYENDDE